MSKKKISPATVIIVLVGILAIIVIYSLLQNGPSKQNQNLPSTQTPSQDESSENNGTSVETQGEQESYLDCENYRCVIVNGSGQNHPDCASTNDFCETGVLCGNNQCDGSFERDSCSKDCTGTIADLIVQEPIDVRRVNDGVLITATIQNIGGEETAIFRNRLTLRDEDFESLSKSVAPGEEIEISEFISLIDGEYEVLIWADLDNRVDESNEENNIVIQQFTVE